MSEFTQVAPKYLEKPECFPLVVQIMTGAGDQETVVVSASGERFPIPAMAKMRNERDGTLLGSFTVDRAVVSASATASRYAPGWTSKVSIGFEGGSTGAQHPTTFSTAKGEVPAQWKDSPGLVADTHRRDHLIVQDDGTISIATEEEVSEARRSGKLFIEEEPVWRARNQWIQDSGADSGDGLDDEDSE